MTHCNIEQLDFNNFGVEPFNWFHPSLTRLADGRWMATMQTISGSDHYGNPMFAISADNGKTWTKPQEIPALAGHDIGNGLREGVADPRIFTSPVDGTVFVFGCSVFYSSQGNVSWDTSVNQAMLPQETGVYAAWRPETGWGKRQTVPFPGLKQNYRSACMQMAFLPDGRMLLPMGTCVGKCLYAGYDSDFFGVITALYRQNGQELIFENASAPLTIQTGRGLLEPSVLRHGDGQYALTLRAEDGNMYLTNSADGLNWSEICPWRWDDGAPLRTDSTQQHWLTLGDRIFLVFTMFDGTNDCIMRFRALLFMAEANPEAGILYHKTLQTLFPRRQKNGVEARYGNFHCASFGPHEAIVTDSAWFVYPKGNDQFDFISEVAAARVTL